MLKGMGKRSGITVCPLGRLMIYFDADVDGCLVKVGGVDIH